MCAEIGAVSIWNSTTGMSSSRVAHSRDSSAIADEKTEEANR